MRKVSVTSLGFNHVLSSVTPDTLLLTLVLGTRKAIAFLMFLGQWFGEARKLNNRYA